MPDSHNSEKKEKQDNADLLYGNLFSKGFFVEPIVPFASLTLFSTRALGDIGIKKNKFKYFFMSCI